MSEQSSGKSDQAESRSSIPLSRRLASDMLRFESVLQSWNPENDASCLSTTLDIVDQARSALAEEGRMDIVLFMDELRALLKYLDQCDKDQMATGMNWLQRTSAKFRSQLPKMSESARLANLLPLMSMLNDGRAFRGEELISSGVLDVMGVPPQEWRTASVSSIDEQEPWLQFRHRVLASRRETQRAILSWFATPRQESPDCNGRQEALQALHYSIASMSTDTPVSGAAQAWNDLVVVALEVLDALIDGRRKEEFALRRLFAHLERCLANVVGSDAHPPPLMLLQNLLWYVVEPGSELVQGAAGVFRFDAELFQRLTLDRVANADLSIRWQSSPRPGQWIYVSGNRGASSDQSLTAATEYSRRARSHANALRIQLLDALVPGEQEQPALPDEAMLRSLQQLNESLQSLEAAELLAELQPLQRQALNKHRERQPLDARIVREFSVLVQHVETALATDSGTVPAGHHQELDDRHTPLVGVFDEEARYLLQRMHRLLDENVASDEAPRIAEALAHLHTLKGSARMTGRVGISEYAHALEGSIEGVPPDRQLARLRDGRKALDALFLDDQAARQSATGDTALAPQSANERPPEPQNQPGAGYDELLKNTTILGAGLASLADSFQRFADIARDLEATALSWHRLQDDGDRQRSVSELELLDDLDAARENLMSELKSARRQQRACSRSSARLQQKLVQSRRVPAEQFRERLQRVLDDATEASSPPLPLNLDGGEILLERDLYRRLLPVLEHLIRNARVHGIEPIGERLAGNKPSSGAVNLAVQADGEELIISVADDGRGVNRTAINEARHRRGEPPLSTNSELQQEICKSGFTTMSGSTAVAGRGLGLSAVRQLVDQLDGRLALWTQPGLGTRVTLTVPQPLVISASVMVRAGRRLYALPADKVRFVEPEQSDIDSAGQQSGAARNRVLNLEHLLGVSPRDSADERAGAGTATSDWSPAASRSGALRRLHIRTRTESLVLEVPEVLGHRELVTQSLGQQLVSLNRFCGGSVLPDGRQILMLDLERLCQVEASGGATLTVPVSHQASRRPTALIVDDSLTMRVAASRYLEARGVHVLLARDGAEALSVMDRQVPSLLVVDIDMPRLDGFELLSRLQLRLGSRLPPTIVISSRDHPDDRQRALSLGAGRFLVKPWDHETLGDALTAVGVRLPDLSIA